MWNNNIHILKVSFISYTISYDTPLASIYFCKIQTIAKRYLHNFCRINFYHTKLSNIFLNFLPKTLIFTISFLQYKYPVVISCTDAVFKTWILCYILVKGSTSCFDPVKRNPHLMWCFCMHNLYFLLCSCFVQSSFNIILLSSSVLNTSSEYYLKPFFI